MAWDENNTYNTQTQDNSVKINLDNVNMDNSTTIGLQGDDLAVVASAMVNQQIASQTALITSQNSANSALTNVIKSNNEAKMQIMGAVQKGGKWLLYLGIAGAGLFAFYKFYGRRRR